MRPLAPLALIAALLSGPAQAGDEIARVIQNDPNPALARGCLRSWEDGRAEFDAARGRFDQLPRALIFLGDGAYLWTGAYLVGRIDGNPFVVAFRTNETPDRRKVDAATLAALESQLDQATAESWEHQTALHQSCGLAVDGQGLALPVQPDAMETADTPVGKAYRRIEALFNSTDPDAPVLDRASVP